MTKKKLVADPPLTNSESRMLGKGKNSDLRMKKKAGAWKPPLQ